MPEMTSTGWPSAASAAVKKRLRIARAAQRVGADDAHLMRLHVAQPLAEPAQARERAFLARGVEVAALVEARCEPHHLAQTVDDQHVALVDPRDDHVEAVRAEVDRGQNLVGFPDGPLASVRAKPRSAATPLS